ncbi:hypothetical protein BN1708_015700 [Verticillium longisporum]|uniref:FAS1 domain-containing protein n=1 Tax=Verticillium longisporum TaxID=100787 RepID=A0A0G4M6E4_VERLO|nr:hypothetical protein BN1708_015700 [Verticillium longisporum]
MDNKEAEGAPTAPNILRLPAELQLHIIQHLTFGELEHLRRTCRFYRAFISPAVVGRLFGTAHRLQAALLSTCRDCLRTEDPGATVFAPSNTAFDRLGPGANAFLFNSEKGLKYLKALLKYHVVANETLYSDHYYKHDQGEEEEVAGDDDGGVEAEGVKHYHVDLPSLLDEKSIAVDITRWGGFIDLKVNGYIHVSVSDAVAKNGVVHVVDSVLLPHRKPGGDAEVDVEELKAMLAPFVEEAENEWNEL